METSQAAERSVKESSDRLKTEKDRLRTNLDTSRAADNDRLTTELEISQAAERSVKEDLTKSNHRNDELQRALDAEEEKTKSSDEQHRVSTEAANADVQRLTSRLNKANTAGTQSQVRVDTLTKENTSLLAKMKEVKFKADRAKADITAVLNEAQTIETDLSNARDQVATLREKIKTLTADKELLTRENSDLKGRQRDAERRKYNAEIELKRQATPTPISDPWQISVNRFAKVMPEQDIRLEGNLLPEVLLWEFSNLLTGEE